jgi:hypothetical protein
MRSGSRAGRARGLAAGWLVVLAAAPLHAQQPGGVEAQVAQVRERVALIQGARLDSVSVFYTTPGGSGQAVAYREGGRLRKVAVRFDGDGASGFNEHYYWNDTLVFAYSRWDRFPPEGPERRSEDRLYLTGGRAVRWIRTAEDGTRRTFGPGMGDFAAASAAMIRGAACWRRFVEAGVSGEVEC